MQPRIDVGDAGTSCYRAPPDASIGVIVSYSRRPPRLQVPGEHIRIPIEDLRRSTGPTASRLEHILAGAPCAFFVTQPPVGVHDVVAHGPVIGLEL